MIDLIVNTLREKPELAIFLTLSIGYLLGKVRVSNFELGSVTVFFYWPASWKVSSTSLEENLNEH